MKEVDKLLEKQQAKYDSKIALIEEREQERNTKLEKIQREIDILEEENDNYEKELKDM